MVAQIKVSNPEEFDKAMKPAGSGHAERSGRMSHRARTRMSRKKRSPALKAAIADTQSFWVLHKKDDAVKMNKESLAKIESFEKLVRERPVDRRSRHPR